MTNMEPENTTQKGKGENHLLQNHRVYDPSLSNRLRQVVVQERIEIHPRKINESNLKMMGLGSDEFPFQGAGDSRVPAVHLLGCIIFSSCIAHFMDECWNGAAKKTRLALYKQIHHIRGICEQLIIDCKNILYILRIVMLL